MPEPPRVLSDSDFDGRALAFAPDGSWLAAAGRGRDPEVRIWDLDTFEARTVRTGWLDDFEVAPDASWLVTVADDRSLWLRDGVTGQVRADLTAARPDPNLPHLFEPPTIPATRFVTAPDGSWLATTGTKSGAVRIWDTATGSLLATIDSGSDGVDQLLISPDSTYLAASGSDGVVRTFDRQGAPLAVLPGHAKGVDQLVIAPDSSWLASTDMDGTVRLWDPRDDTPRHVHSGDGYSRVVRKVAVDPDSGWLVTACMDRCVRIWDAATGQSHAELKYLAEWVDHIAIAPDGSWLATAGKNLVHIWDPATGQARPEQSRHPQWVSQLVASADGSRLLSLDHEGTVRLWFAPTGEVLRQVETGARHGPKHQPALDPHVPWVATLAYGRVLLWDLTG